MTDSIAHINETIADLLQGEHDLKAYTLAESIAVRGDEDITFPALILPTGECIDVYGETDKHDITLYHRLNDISFQEDNTSSFGSHNGYTEAADMSLIVFGKRKCLSPFEMERIARKAIAFTDKCTLSRSDFNMLQIFASEYVGVTYFMSPEYYLFKINYRITRPYNAGCN